MMKRSFQSLLLRLYKTASDSGFISTAWGRALFEWCYEQYKILFDELRVSRAIQGTNFSRRAANRTIRNSSQPWRQR